MARKKRRNGFASSFGFIMAAAGSAVGLGNLWGFPYKAAKGGGAAFVIVYIACVLLLGLVIMLTEMHIGKRAQANPVTAYKKAGKGLGWIGLLAVLIPFFITCYYSVLGGWTVKYAMNSFGGNVAPELGNAGIVGNFSTNTLEVILFTAIFIILAIVVIRAGVEGGIEKMSKILMPALFVILVGIVIYSLCLGEGVSEGLAFYMNPDFSKLTFDTVLTAMGQAFWSLSLGMGIMITYGSYTGKKINLVKSTGMICLFDTLVAFLAGLAIFPAVAHFDPALLEGSKGVALIYIILPQVFGSMGVVGSIVSFFFFAMVVIAALTSVISLMEVATQFVIQKFKISRKRAITVVAVLALVISIPIGMSLGQVAIAENPNGISFFGMDLLTYFDEVTNTVLMPFCALLACIVVGWVIKPKKAMEEMEEEGTKFAGWMKALYPIFVKFITPLLVIVVEVFGIYNKFTIEYVENQKAFLGVCITAGALLAICIIVYFALFANGETGTNADELEANAMANTETEKIPERVQSDNE